MARAGGGAGGGVKMRNKFTVLYDKQGGQGLLPKSMGVSMETVATTWATDLMPQHKHSNRCREHGAALRNTLVKGHCSGRCLDSRI